MKILQVIPDAYVVEFQRMGHIKHISYSTREAALRAAYTNAVVDDKAWSVVTPIPGGWLVVEDNERLVLLTNDELMATLEQPETDEMVSA